MKELNIFEATALTSPNPLTLICSENEDGTTNLAPICFVSYLSFNPPMIGFATGKQAHTGERVRETGKVIVTVIFVVRFGIVFLWLSSFRFIEGLLSCFF